MKRLSARLSPRFDAPSKKEATFDIGGMCALKWGQESRQAREWFDALSDSDRQVWLTIARSENMLDAWKAFKRKCE